MNNGRLFLITGPSGVGKTALVSILLESDTIREDHPVRTLVSYTTRKPRDHERDGVDYQFVTKDRFAQMRRRDLFLEHAEVHGEWYGTPYVDWVASRDVGTDVIHVVDWQGAKAIRDRVPGACWIALLPPSMAELRTRLEERNEGSLTPTDEARLRDAKDELVNLMRADVLITNTDLDDACLDVMRAMQFPGLTRRYSNALIRNLLDECE